MKFFTIIQKINHSCDEYIEVRIVKKISYTTYFVQKCKITVSNKAPSSIIMLFKQCAKS